jgi:4'-phosphopantetheinyl transferase
MSTGEVSSLDCRRWLRILDRNERERAGRLRFENDRRDFIAAHVLLRSMLTAHWGRPAWAWKFATGIYGKPTLAQEFHVPELDFSLSHTRGLVAAAMVSRRTIGVDAEKIDHAKSALAIARNYFAASEIKMLQQMPQRDQADCFFRLWTLKEAYLKATGAGLATPLDSFAFTLTPLRINFLTASNLPQHWYFETLPTTSQHMVSVAVGSWSDHPVCVVAHPVAVQDL